MNRDAFIDFLARLISDGLLTEETAHALLRQFDAGPLADWELPLPTALAIRGHNRDKEKAALALLLLLVGDQSLKGLAENQRINIAHGLQDDFATQTATLAAGRTSGALTLPAWQLAMIALIDKHTTTQGLLGSGGALTAAQNARIDALMVEQSAYLQRFADHAALNQATGEAYSEGYLANRSESYGGPGLGEFFRSYEEGQGSEVGYVEQYIAVDDRGTCGPCHDAQGFYLSGQGPMPGEICYGGSRCRCRRERVFRPDIYAELTAS